MNFLTNKKSEVFFLLSKQVFFFVPIIFFLMTLTGCSGFSSYTFFEPDSNDSLLHEITRNDWITTNQGYGTIRPPLKSVDISGEGKLTIFPVELVRGRIEAIGPPLLSIIWIPSFMCPPLDSPNVIHFVCTGEEAKNLRVESINNTSINKDSVKVSEYRREIHYFLSISKSDAKKDTLDVEVSIGQDMIGLEFKKIRTKNWFPLFVPL